MLGRSLNRFSQAVAGQQAEVGLVLVCRQQRCKPGAGQGAAGGHHGDVFCTAQLHSWL